MKARFLISLGLILSLVLTSQAMASLRGAPGPAGAVVLCIGGAAVVVQVDAEGQPVSAPHFCPDCALQAVPLPDAAHGPIRPAPRAVTVGLSVQVPAMVRAPVGLPQSRAPPTFV